MKHISGWASRSPFGEAVNRMARALKRTGSPAAEVANGRTVMECGPGNASDRGASTLPASRISGTAPCGRGWRCR